MYRMIEKNKHEVTIIVPVYGDLSSLSKCIMSLQKHTDPIRHQVLLVNDCGPEADKIEKNIKELIKSSSNFTYKRNKKNLGFVMNCNGALKYVEPKTDIMLLNSDAEITEGAIEELQSVIKEEKIGAVSPRSNNATICTIPLRSMPIKGLSRSVSKRIFNQYYAEFPPYNLTPTAHGFCMLIKRDLIDKYGLFDDVFGRGYGEEVDFCRRIKKNGWNSALANHAFVFHAEAKSFSMETKKELLKTNSVIIRERYPDYKQEVTEYISFAEKQEDKIYGRLNFPKLLTNVEKLRRSILNRQ